MNLVGLQKEHPEIQEDSDSRDSGEIGREGMGGLRELCLSETINQ